MKSKITLFLAIFGLLFVYTNSFSQIASMPGGTNIKVGYLRCNHGENLFSISAERQLFQNLSAELKFGGNPFLGNKSSTNDIFDFHFSASARYFFALRRDMALSGFYTGAFYGVDRLNFYGPKFSPKTGFFKSSTLGTQLGYQHRIGSRFVVDGGLQLGYHLKSRYIENDANGNFQEEYKMGNGFSGNLHLAFGVMLHQNRNGNKRETPPAF